MKDIWSVSLYRFTCSIYSFYALRILVVFVSHASLLCSGHCFLQGCICWLLDQWKSVDSGYSYANICCSKATGSQVPDTGFMFVLYFIFSLFLQSIGNESLQSIKFSRNYYIHLFLNISIKALIFLFCFCCSFNASQFSLTHLLLTETHHCFWYEGWL